MRKRATTLRWRLAAVGVLVVVAATGLRVVNRTAGAPAQANALDAAAVSLLEHAALTAQNLPLLPDGPGRYVFVESAVQWSSTMGHTWTLEPLKVRRAWLASDGRSVGLASERLMSQPDGWKSGPLPGCPGDRPLLPSQPWSIVMDGQGNVVDYNCQPVPAYHSELPTTTEAMVAYLHDSTHYYYGGDRPENRQIFMLVEQLLQESYIPPAALAALFRATAQIPGVTVDDDVVDAADRHGIAVACTHNAMRMQLIFDPKTYAFLGTRAVASESIDGLTAGQLTQSTAVLRVAVVDRAGTLP
jgi:hypothetical protein